MPILKVIFYRKGAKIVFGCDISAARESAGNETRCQRKIAENYRREKMNSQRVTLIQAVNFNYSILCLCSKKVSLASQNSSKLQISMGSHNALVVSILVIFIMHTSCARIDKLVVREKIDRVGKLQSGGAGI